MNAPLSSWQRTVLLWLYDQHRQGRSEKFWGIKYRIAPGSPGGRRKAALARRQITIEAEADRL